LNLPPPKKLKDIDSRPLESDVEGAVCRYARAKGMLVYKFTSPQRRGVPDRLFIPPDRCGFFIEFKRLGKKATPEQIREIRKLQSKGQHVYVVDNVEDGKRIIDKHAPPI
jgi:hypothetical protein